MNKTHPNYYFPVKNEIVSYTGTADESAAISAQIEFVRLVATTDCHIKITKAGTSAVAATDMLLPANKPEIFNVSQGLIVSVIQNASGGNLHVTELTRV